MEDYSDYSLSTPPRGILSVLTGSRGAIAHEGQRDHHALHEQNRRLQKLKWNFPPQHSLQSSSPFGGYREKYTRERHARGDAKAGGGGEKGELATITHKFSYNNCYFNLHFHPRKPRDNSKSENCHRNQPQIRNVTTACQV